MEPRCLLAVMGDYDMSGVVDQEDYAAWKVAYGDTGTHLAADGNGDGVVDAVDYTVWRNNLGAEALSGDIEDHVMFQGGVLTICGTIFDDIITVTATEVTIDGIGTLALNVESASAIVVHAFGGYDVVSIDPAVTVDSTLFGGTGDDIVGGGSGADTIDGGAGADSLYGGLGNDVLIPGDGDDLLFGEEGEDILYMGDGLNVLYGGPDTDDYRTGEGNGYLDDIIIDDDQTIAVSGSIGTPNHRPQINPVPTNHQLTVNQAFSLQLTATDLDSPPQTLSWFANSPLPAGASFNNGLFTWTPTTAQNGLETTIQFMVQDDGLSPLSDVRSLSFSVAAPSLERPIISEARPEPGPSTWGNIIDIPFVAGASTYIIERRVPGGEWAQIGTGLNGITRLCPKTGI